MTADSDARAKLQAVREQADAAVRLTRLVEDQRREAIFAAIEAGMSQSEIARQLRLTQQAVSKILKSV